MFYEKTGYLTEDYKYFHINDISDRTYEFHYHDFYKVIFFISGDVTYNVEGKSYELKPMDIVLVGRNEIHCPIVSAKKAYERIVIYLSDIFLSEKLSDSFALTDCFQKASKEHVNVLRFSQKESTRLFDILKRSESYKDADSFGSDAYMRLAILEFLVRLNEYSAKNVISYNGRVVYNEKILKVIDHINNNLKEDLSVEALSLCSGLSRFHLMKVFKEYTGYTIHRYVTEKRLNLVSALSDGGMKIKDACVEAGFSDYATYLRTKKNYKNTVRPEEEYSGRSKEI